MGSEGPRSGGRPRGNHCRMAQTVAQASPGAARELKAGVHRNLQVYSTGCWKPDSGRVATIVTFTLWLHERIAPEIDNEE